jgi:hypothetical protein
MQIIRKLKLKCLNLIVRKTLHTLPLIENNQFIKEVIQIIKTLI